MHIPGYNIEQTPTESSASGTLIYISQKRSYKNKPDFQIYHLKHLESTFIEILLTDKSNFIIGTVYNTHQWNHTYLTLLFHNYFKKIIKKKTKKQLWRVTLTSIS